MENASNEASLKRGLGERQVSLMALGAAIGVGLFYGSASAIKLAGPSILLAYAACGVFVFFIMRALGEMAVHNPVAGSFSRYAYEYIGPRTGFLTGWTYWFMWIVCIMAEVTAASVYMKFWFPDVPAWIWSLSALLSMGLLNLIAVRAFGELEFWFAAIKVVTILFLIVSGIGTILLGLGNGGVPTGISNLWTHGGFFPHGAWGLLSSFPMVAFAYVGVEMIGLTAGETANPKKTLARAVDSVFWRIAIFYVGALFVVMSLYPWDQIGTQGSPFVLTFERLGIRQAAGVMNFVVLSAALSSCNSGIFSTGRMLFNLAGQGHAPACLRRTSRKGLPFFAIAVGVVAALLGILLNFVAPKDLFVWLTAIATFAGLFTWAVIVISHIRFRARINDSTSVCRMPWAPFSSYATLAFLGCITVLMCFFDETRVALVIGPIWLAALCCAHTLMKKGANTTVEIFE